jgi:hypothetical protein
MLVGRIRSNFLLQSVLQQVYPVLLDLAIYPYDRSVSISSKYRLGNDIHHLFILLDHFLQPVCIVGVLRILDISFKLPIGCP